MFTGLIEHVGTVAAIKEFDDSESGGKGWTVTIGDAAVVLSDCQLGDSICVNGACLTVTEFDKDSFKVGLAPETLSRTDLGKLKKGSKVNLERAMQTGARYGGHVVQGHVDTTATIIARQQDGNSIRYTLQMPDNQSAHDYQSALVEKGYIAIDGTSLTLTTVDDAQRTFGIMLIAHSQERVVLTDKTIGDVVNIEVDIVSKTVAKIVHQALAKASIPTQDSIQAMIDKAIQKASSKQSM